MKFKGPNLKIEGTGTANLNTENTCIEIFLQNRNR